MGVAPAGRGVLRGRDVNGPLLRPVGLPGGLRWFAGDVFSEHEAEGHSGERAWMHSMSAVSPARSGFCLMRSAQGWRQVGEFLRDVVAEHEEGGRHGCG